MGQAADLGHSARPRRKSDWAGRRFREFSEAVPGNVMGQAADLGILASYWAGRRSQDFSKASAEF